MKCKYNGKERVKNMQNQATNLIIEDLDPTFLFTWKGNRGRDLDTYHSHDHIEMAYVISGNGKYLIEDRLYDVAEGDLLIFNPGVRHQSLPSEEGDTPTTEFFIGFSNIQLQDLEKNYIPLPGPGNILHTAGELRQKIFKICSSMEAENALGYQGRYFVLKAYLMQMLVYVIRAQSQPMEVPAGYAFESINKKYVVEQIVSYFEDHYSEKISLDRIAENMYLSTFYISKIFKTETGDTPIHRLIKIRLEKAREILEKDADLSIKEVADRVGYKDVYHFSKQFKKHYGISPSKIRP